MLQTEHPMDTIVQPIQLLVSDEYDRAAGIHGGVFASVHEGYGVIAEEVQEAEDAMELAESIMHLLLIAIREEKPAAITDMAGYIRAAAVNGAAELIQVAAMCDKIVVTIKEENK